MPHKLPKHVRRVRSKGRDYYYFDTGKRVGTKKVYAALPSIRSPQFGATYATLLGHRNRVAEKGAMEVPALIGLYQKSPAYRAELSPRSQRAYDTYLSRLERLLPSAPVAAITRPDMQLLIDGMADTPGAANLFLGSCSAMFAWAEGRGYVSANPCKGIVPLKMGEHQPWPEHVLDAALASDDANVRLLTHLLYYTAQRLRDVLALTWSDVAGDRLVVVQDKTDKRLSMPLHDNLKHELRQTPKRALLIAVDQKGRPFTPNRARQVLQDFAATMGVKVVPHGLRKNAVIALLEYGCSVAETASISGQSLQMVEHYSKERNQARLADAAILRWEQKANMQTGENRS